jgi:prephenate dehydratase
VRRAVLPIENTTAGIIQPVWDRLLGITPGPALSALAEARVRIGFVAAALPGSATKVRKILSHLWRKRSLQNHTQTLITILHTLLSLSLIISLTTTNTFSLSQIPITTQIHYYHPS